MSNDSYLIIRSKSKGRGMFSALFRGDEICSSRQPFFDGARKLSAMGLADDAGLLCFTGQNQIASFRSTIGEMKALTVHEPDRGRIRIKKFTPNPMFAEREHV
jgi:hypothetical protein